MLTKDQIEARKAGIGGSDAAAVCGLDQYRQPLDVYLEKVEGIRDETVGDKESVRWGNLLENAIAKEWAERNGVKVRKSNILLRHPEYEWMLGNIDRRIEGVHKGLEIKARGAFAASDYGPSGTDQVKDSDIMQCQHYLAVTGWSEWYMAILIGGQELRSYVIPRDENLIDSLYEIENDFWWHVQQRERPPMLYEHTSAEALLNRMYPGTNGERILLPDRAVEIRTELVELASESSAVDKRKKALKAELRDMLEESAIGLLPGGGGGWRRKLVQRKGYEVKPSEYIDMRFSGKLE